MIDVVLSPSEENPFAVIVKPRGLASAPLAPGGHSAVEEAACLFPQIRTVRGKKPVELGLVHRLDTQTCGLLLVAATQQCYDALAHSQSCGRFVKTYEAACTYCAPPDDGSFPPAPDRARDIAGLLPGQTARLTVASRFRPFGQRGSQVRPVTGQSGAYQLRKASPKAYETAITVTRTGGTYRAECTITQGFRHQVRCHLAWVGLPVTGDPLYAPDTYGQDMQFWATRLSFPHPLTSRSMEFSLK